MQQKEKILALMISRKGNQEWFYAPDFMKPELGELFVGYEASARMTDCAKDYPYMIEAKKVGKYRYIRFKFERIDEIFSIAGPAMVDFLDRTFTKYNVPKDRNRAKPIPADQIKPEEIKPSSLFL